MLKRTTFAAAAALCLAVPPALAGPPASSPTIEKIELTRMMGRWYEVARLPNNTQKGCQAGTSDWMRVSDGFSVIQACRKGAVDGPVAQWKAKAKVADPETNAKFKMSFFGGMISQEYWVLDHKAEEGWLILSTRDGKYLWLMSQKPTLPAQIRAQALTRIKQLGFDPGRLEFPNPAKS
jgi:apolipoprotein D and lipocalin family protein